MIEIVKDTRKAAKQLWTKIDASNSNFKSWIKFRFNFKTKKIEWYFRYSPDYEIDKESKKKVSKLSYLAEDWARVIDALKR